MARRRFFVDSIKHDHAELTGDDARHLSRVLRAETGQRYEISDNEHVYLAEISEIAAARISFRVLAPLPTQPPAPEITLAAALTKFERYEWMIEKATELGASRIIPVNAGQSEKGLKLAAAKRVERWRKIARESSQQSRRDRLPEIAAPVEFGAALNQSATYRYLLEEQSGAQPLLTVLPEVRSPLATIAVLIGPEGGWTDREREAAESAGWKPVSVGSNILRAETAAATALAILSNAWLAPATHR